METSLMLADLNKFEKDSAAHLACQLASYVTSWITSEGHETLQRFANIQFDTDVALKKYEQEFEKYYFISMKHLAKGRDLLDATANIAVFQENAVSLKRALDGFAEKLEKTRERIEGSTQLHQLLSCSVEARDEHACHEIERLAEQIGGVALVEKCREQMRNNINNSAATQMRIKPNSLNLNGPHSLKKSNLYASTPASKANRASLRASSGLGSFEGQACHCWREDVEDMDEHEDDEEEQSKIADSGVGGCERCEGNPKLARVCSCQSLIEARHLYDKCHNSDELDDECYERPIKRYLDIHSPIEANTHLTCYSSSMNLPKMEELSCLDPKTQKTLLLIMNEMIGTERDYVRSLYYVIENYMDELLREDIPQPLRGQRNVIFGNIEKIFEFHNSHFLSELERYEHYPLRVGAAFLEMESKFYLYALYNKNKPKSDTLMSEYGTAFFKSKQFELNDKMDLASYLLKPVQRMGKYALLLQQLVKACSSVQGTALQEISNDVEELQRAEQMVKFQLRHGNDLLAMDSLRDCDVNVKEQGRLLRQNEFLVWQGRCGKKTLRQVFLFEELVLFSKARRFPDHKNLDIYIYKNSIKTADIGLTAHVGDSTTKFEIWFRKLKPDDTWTLQCISEDVKKAWTEEISQLLWKQAKRNREIRLAEMSSMGIGSKPCLDIRPSNNQINDRSVSIAQFAKTPKLRNSYVGTGNDTIKSNARRPHSVISESSISSGTSSSTSSSSHERIVGHGSCVSNNANSNFATQQQCKSMPNACHALELINESQALNLTNTNNSNTLSSNASSGISAGHLKNHKRSTTLVSQLSMESGILSDISMTPDVENADNNNMANAAATSSWSSAALTATANSATLPPIIGGVVMRRSRKNYKLDGKPRLSANSNQNLYMKNAVEQYQNRNPYIKVAEEENVDL